MLHLGRLEYVLRDLELPVSDINLLSFGNKLSKFYNCLATDEAGFSAH